MTGADPFDHGTESPAKTNAECVESSREYLRIRPTDTSISPTAVHTQFRRLYDLAWEHAADSTGWGDRLARTLVGTERTPQSVEFLLVTDGDVETPLHYYVGIDAGGEAETVPESNEQERTGIAAEQRASTASDKSRRRATSLGAFERLVRAMLPNAYEIDRVRWHPSAVLGERTPGGTASDPTTDRTRDAGGDTEPPRRDGDGGTDDCEPDRDRSADSTHDRSRDQTPTASDSANSPTTRDSSTAAEPTYDAVEFVGQTSRRGDWQTRLVPLRAWDDDTDTDTDSRPPFTTVVETLAASPVPAVYQVLLQPLPPWTEHAAEHRANLLRGRESVVDRLLVELGWGSEDYGERNRERLERRRGEDDDPLGSDGPTARHDSPVDRVQSIEFRDADHSFVVNARVVARTDPAAEADAMAASGDRPRHPEADAPHTASVDALCTDLTSAFSTMSGPYHSIEGRHRRGSDATAVRDALCDRTVHAPEYDRLATRLPGVAHTSRGIVADPQEAPGFCLLDGGSLTPTAMEALAPTPGERARPRGPPPSQDLLSRYRGPGLTLGTFQPGWTTGVDTNGIGYHAPSRAGAADDQGDSDESFLVRLPPALQRLHVAWFGKTGSGKTTAAAIGLLDNHAATDGATVLVDQKGDGMADDLLRMKYARDGPDALDDVVYFDAARHLPAFSFFDIRDQLAAGVPRAVAVRDVIAHYVEILIQLRSREWYYNAPLSAKLIEAVLTALFDPVHGADAFSHREFRQVLSWMIREQAAPAVSDVETQTVLEDAVSAGDREFRNIMNGVINRVDEISNETYLSTVLNHVGPDPTTGAARDRRGERDRTEQSDSPDPSNTEQTDTDQSDSPDSRVSPNPHDNSTADTAAGQDETPSTPCFEFADHLDEDAIIIFDMGGLREEAQRALTVLVVSKLWTALRWRTHRQQRLYGHDWSPATDTDDSVPLSERRSPSRTVDAVAARDVDMDDGRSAATAAIGDAGDVDTVDEADTSDAVGVDELGEAAAEIGVDDSLETDDAVGAAERLADREAAGDTGTGDPDDLPLVNLFVEEASKVAASGVVTDLLKQARSFGCAVTLSMQYPAQLRHVDEETYDEVLNNVSTVVTGNVPLDRDLAARLATSDMEPQAVANRLRALSRGEWFCALPAGFGEVEPRPFVLHSAPLPPGHPEGPRPLSSSDQLRYDVAQLRCEARTRDHYGLTIATPAVVGTDPDAGDVGGERAMTGVDADRDTDSDGETDEDRLLRVDTVLPYTRRLPETVTYVAARHALDCTECGNRYDPSPEGMRRAICCCSSLDAVDPDDIPVTTVNLKLTREERVETGLSDRELLLLQVIHNAQQLRYEPPAYDLLHDSMIRLLEYVGASTEDVQNLIDAGYLTHDANHPHRLYSVTPQGRTVIGEAYREGVDFGHGKGDLEETSLHVLMVEVGYRYLVNSYQENPDSSVETVVKYFDLDRAPTETTGTVDDAAASDDDVAGETDVAAEEPNSDVGVDTETTPDTDTDPTQRDARRLDVAGLDAEGNVVVTLEAERVNHDVRRAAPADYDKMAACDPEDAIWVCSTQKEGYTILRALNDPLDGTPRVEKEYSSTTPTHQYRIDTPGLTAMYNVEYLRDRLQDESL